MLFGSGMMKQMLNMLKPHLNKIGDSLFNISEERGIPAPADVRIVITARRDDKGNVHTFMQYAQSTPAPTPESPLQRTIDTLRDADGKLMIFGIEQLAKMLGGNED